MKQRKPAPVREITLSAFGVFAAGVFSMWANRREVCPPLINGLAAIIAGIVGWVLARVGLKTLSGWAAAGFIAWWVIQAPADAGHLMANLAVVHVERYSRHKALRRVGLTAR